MQKILISNLPRFAVIDFVEDLFILEVILILFRNLDLVLVEGLVFVLVLWNCNTKNTSLKTSTTQILNKKAIKIQINL